MAEHAEEAEDAAEGDMHHRKGAALSSPVDFESESDSDLDSDNVPSPAAP